MTTILNNASYHNVKKAYTITNAVKEIINDVTGKKSQEIADHIIASKDKIFIDTRAMGEGKTQVMALISKDPKNVEHQLSYVTHRVALAKCGSMRLGIEFYKNIDLNENKKRKIAMCVNSILKYNISDKDTNLVLMIDEFVQLIDFISIGTVKNREEIQEELIEAINNADTVVLADADFNDFCLNWIKKHTNKKIEIIKSTPPPHKKKITDFKKIEILLSDASKNLSEGKKIWFACDSKEEINNLKIRFESFSELLITMNRPALKILSITSDNKGDSLQKDFLKNPNEESKKYDLILCSPVINSGISIDNNNFDFIYAIFKNIITANEMCQTIGRVRSVTDIRVAFILGHKKDRQTNPHHLLDGENFVKARFLGNRSYQISEFSEQQTNVRANRNKSLNNFKFEFLMLAELKGYEVIEIEDYESTPLTELLEDTYTQRVLNAVKLTKEDVESLVLTSDTQSENDSLERILVQETTGKSYEDLNEDHIKFYKNGGLERVRNLELLQYDENLLKDIDLLNYECRNESKKLTSRKFFITSMVVILENKEYNFNNIPNVLKLLQENHKELTVNGLGDFENIKSISKVNNLMKKIGYKIECKRNNKNIRSYKIEVDEEVAEYVENRKLNGVNL